MGVILGLDTRTIRSPESHVPLDGDGEVYTFVKEGDSVVDMKQGFESLYVYTNVVESRVVGDSLVPLLRIVPIQGEHGHTISRHFEHVQYLPLLRKEFGTIEIDVRDDTGQAVPFERGKVTVTQDWSVLKNELQRLLHPTGGRRSTLLCRCQSATRTRVG